MKKVFTSFYVIAALVFSTSSFAQTLDVAQFFVKPPDYELIPGTATFTGPFANNDRSYQMLIHDSILTDLVGKEIQALSWRLPGAASANWPPVECTYGNFDIYIGQSVAPENRSLDFAANRVGPQKLVRSGSLIIPQDSYTFGNVPNDFGPEITFDSLYLYTGGHLLIEIRHTSSNTTTRSLDAISTSTAGYLTAFSALWQSSYVPTTGLQGNFCVTRLTADDPVPVEFTSFFANVENNNVVLDWSTATETNNSGFQIERKLMNSEYEAVGFIIGAGTTTEPRSYSFTDNQLSMGEYTYRLKQIDYDGSFDYSSEISVEITAPSVYSLEQNFPNPFNPSTKINFSIAESGIVKIVVYNMLGQEVSLLLNDFEEAGQHTITFDASSLTSGVYFYKLETSNYIQTRKMILAK